MIAEVLHLGKPAQSPRCTACHAPFQSVPASARADSVRASESVSCENCHGPAQAWLRSHTRPDLAHEDRVHAGLRDLKNLYVRANSCIACHQTVETELLAAGHPELIFELDGQTVSEPKHWREEKNFFGAQAWLVGQAVALREMSWQISREKKPNEKLQARWNGLRWLLQKVDALNPNFPSLRKISTAGDAQKSSDKLAQRAAELKWTAELSRKCLRQLAVTFPDFRDKNVSQEIQARRAERLVLALDRLTISANGKSSLEPELNQLFKLAQSIPDFNPAEFSTTLENFLRKLDQVLK